MWLPSPSFGVFLAGDLVAGAGAGLMFKGAIGTVSEISLPERRAEALAGLFLAAYLGLAGPVIGLGALTQVASHAREPARLLGAARASASSPRPPPCSAARPSHIHATATHSTH